MRHLKSGKKLGRSPSHRKAMYRNMAMALFRHERITTTLAKAKAVRPFVEKLITLAKRGDLHSRRLAMSRLGSAGQAEVKPSDDEKEADTRTVIQKLFEEIGPRYAERAGGYTRIIKLAKRRLGDGGLTAFLELLKEGEEKIVAKQPAPAPAVEDEEEDEEDEEEEDEYDDETSAEAEEEEGDEDEEEEDDEDKEAAAEEETKAGDQEDEKKKE